MLVMFGIYMTGPIIRFGCKARFVTVIPVSILL